MKLSRSNYPYSYTEDWLCCQVMIGSFILHQLKRRADVQMKIANVPYLCNKMNFSTELSFAI